MIMEPFEALKYICEQNAIGKTSDGFLVKACNNYKDVIGFDDSYEYNVIVSKSLYDYLNGKRSNEINKAILPGQTKVIDGVTYIYTSTPNAQTQYDWRVYKGNKPVGRQTTQNQRIAKQKHVNDLFPSDFKELKEIKKLGGSTGAVLMEDSEKNQYVVKKGSNTLTDHVRNEYLANQLYDIMGVRVPDYELYDEGNEIYLVSKFIPMTTTPTTKDHGEMAKNFAVDALLANWDVYMNDNCLKDASGRIYRVDNGGSMGFSAQGKTKNFGKKVTDFKSMLIHNPTVLGSLKNEDFIKQIDELLLKRDDVIGYLEIGGENAKLIDIFDGRFDDLQSIRDSYQAKIDRLNVPIKPRTLLPDQQMYRDFTDDEINDLWKNQIGSDFHSKVHHKGSNGWELLESICKERGFDGRPLVVDDADYWSKVPKTKIQMFRGIESKGNVSAMEYADDFKYNDECFFGSIGIYGEGIYFHVNDGSDKSNTKQTYQSSSAYSNSYGYAGGKHEGVISCLLDDTAKVVKVNDLIQEIKRGEGLDINDIEVKAKQSEITDLETERNKIQTDIDSITHDTTDKIKTEMRWDEDTLIMMPVEIDNIDWGKLNGEGEPDYPSFDTFFPKMKDWVTVNGGTVVEKEPKTDCWAMKLPNSSETFEITKWQYEHNAIKRKHAFATPYHLNVRRFKDWLMKEHYQIIEKRIANEISQIDGKIVDLNNRQKDITKTLRDKRDELKKLLTVDNPNKTFFNGIYQDVQDGYSEAVGLYAAYKGYDAIIQPHGNGGSNSFLVVLNRTKVIVNKE